MLCVGYNSISVDEFKGQGFEKQVKPYYSTHGQFLVKYELGALEVASVA